MSSEFGNPPSGKLQRVISTVSAIFGMITPIAIFVVGYLITVGEQARQEQNRKFDVLVRVGPTLFENDSRKILFALQIIYDAGVDKDLVIPILMLIKDAFSRPEIARAARALLAKWLTLEPNGLSLEQLLDIASSNPDPNIRIAATEVVAQNSQPEKIQELAVQTGSPAVRSGATGVLDTPYVVWIASMSVQSAANAFAKAANETFLNKKVELSADVVSPEDNGTSYWGVSAGKPPLTLKEAHSRLQKARRAGFNDAFIARYRSSS